MHLRLSILAKLLLAYVVPTLVLFGLFGFFAYDTANRELEAELGTRLSAIASSAATQIRGKYLVELLPGDEQERAFLNSKRKLDSVRARTGVARIMIVDARQRMLCDTEDGASIGSTTNSLDLDRHELDRVFKDGAAVSSLLFRDPQGGFAKAGYAPVFADDADHTIVAAIRVEAPATYFARLVSLRQNIMQVGALFFVVVVGVSVFVAMRFTRPLRTLASAAERMGHGELDVPVPASPRDEIGVLAATLEEMRQGLLARDENMQMMLAGIAHEVRNPLAGMELYAGILAEELADDPEKRAHVAKVQREVGHLSRVVTDFLAYARRPPPDKKDTDVTALLTEVSDLLAGESAPAAVAIELSCPSELRHSLDPETIRRALLNLVRNAIQASEAGATVQIVASHQDGQLRIAVIDQGSGIDEGAMKKLCTPFFTTREKGTGLGLALAKEIAGDHGGSLRVETSTDTSTGTGTTFFLELT